ncbi:Ras GTPase [Pelomyxa schiedti]|nr:Ras GTPase [Pelomyxa schiedti]
MYFGPGHSDRLLEAARCGQSLTEDDPCNTDLVRAASDLFDNVAAHVDNTNGGPSYHLVLDHAGSVHVPSLSMLLGIHGAPGYVQLRGLLGNLRTISYEPRYYWSCHAFGPVSMSLLCRHVGELCAAGDRHHQSGERHCGHCNQCKIGRSPFGCHLSVLRNVSVTTGDANFKSGISSMCGHLLGVLVVQPPDRLPKAAMKVEEAEALSTHLQHLEEFESRTEISARAMAEMAPHISVSTSLRVLALPRCGLDEKCIQILSSGLISNVALQELILDKNPIGDSSMSYLSQALCRRPPLMVLSLGKCNISEPGCLTLATISEGHRPASLNIRDNVVGETALQKLSAVFQVPPFKFCIRDDIKIACVGGGGIGTKSATIIQFVQSHFITEYDPTIEDSYRKQVTVDGITVMCDILDTAGQEEYSAMREQYMKSYEVFSLGYATTSRDSFCEVPRFHDQIIRLKDTIDYPKILIGGKCDLVAERKVSTEEGKALAKEMRCPFFESSACLRINIEESFHEMIRIALQARYQAMCGTSNAEKPRFGSFSLSKAVKKIQHKKVSVPVKPVDLCACTPAPLHVTDNINNDLTDWRDSVGE